MTDNSVERPSGRDYDEMRDMEAEVGVLEKADGSARFKIGGTEVVAGVFGPGPVHPKHLTKEKRAILSTYYTLTPFSVTPRKRPGPGRRSKEIGEVIKKALEPAVFLEKYPKSKISLHVDVIQADAGTRCACLSALSLALADAGIEMRDMVPSVAAGRINGEVVADLDQKEEKIEDAVDIPIGYLPSKDEVTLLQMDGNISKEELEEAIDLGVEKCKEIHEVQKKAIKRKYEQD